MQSRPSMTTTQNVTTTYRMKSCVGDRLVKCRASTVPPPARAAARWIHRASILCHCPMTSAWMGTNNKTKNVINIQFKLSISAFPNWSINVQSSLSSVALSFISIYRDMHTEYIRHASSWFLNLQPTPSFGPLNYQIKNSKTIIVNHRKEK